MSAQPFTWCNRNSELVPSFSTVLIHPLPLFNSHIFQGLRAHIFMSEGVSFVQTALVLNPQVLKLLWIKALEKHFMHFWFCFVILAEKHNWKHVLSCFSILFHKTDSYGAGISNWITNRRTMMDDGWKLFSVSSHFSSKKKKQRKILTDCSRDVSLVITGSQMRKVWEIKSNFSLQ